LVLRKGGECRLYSSAYRKCHGGQPWLSLNADSHGHKPHGQSGNRFCHPDKVCREALFFLQSMLRTGLCRAIGSKKFFFDHHREASDFPWAESQISQGQSIHQLPALASSDGY
jgi:hypothetical protein